jgi:hypothetical protein
MGSAIVMLRILLLQRQTAERLSDDGLGLFVGLGDGRGVRLAAHGEVAGVDAEDGLARRPREREQLL